jgi:methylmalonyl-CoA mutase N-terminal domain/subunit
MHGLGANALEQFAFGVANAMALADECMKAKIDPDRFMPGIGFQIANGNDFFEYIAMFRAWRRMWARIARERYGCKRPASMHLRVHSHTSCIDLTAQQPLVNLIRTTLHALGAMLSGTTAMELPGYDEPLGLPTEEAAILSLRIQQVLLHETNIKNVVDPLGGSYYLESLTNQMEEEAWKIINQIEEMGGFVTAMDTGWLTKQCRDSADRWRAQINQNERVVVGWNKYAIPEDKELEYKVFEVDPEVERRAVERIKDYRARRDQSKTDEALKKLNEAAYRVLEGEYGHLMPAAIEAARAKATIGEICDAFKEPFGWGHSIMATA